MLLGLRRLKANLVKLLWFNFGGAGFFGGFFLIHKILYLLSIPHKPATGLSSEYLYDQFCYKPKQNGLEHFARSFSVN